MVSARCRGFIAAGVVSALQSACSGGGGDGGTTNPPPVSVASVSLSQSSANTVVGQTLTLSATPRDAANNVLTGRAAATWSSSNAAVASVGATTGIVTGLSSGTTEVTATIEGRSAAAQVTVFPAGTMTISSIAPGTLMPGLNGTITGNNFSTNTAAHTLTVGGVPVSITAATPTTIAFTMPTSGFPCQFAKPTAVVLTRTLSNPANAMHPLATGTQRNVPLGDALYLFGAADVACNQFPVTGGEYLVSVINTTQTPTASSGFDLTGSDGTATGMAAVPPAPVPPPLSVPVGLRSLMDEMAARDKAHGEWLERSLAFLRTHESPVKALQRARANGERFTSTVPPTVGAVVSINVPDLNSSNLCTNSLTISGRVVYAGTRAIIVEDAATPLAGTMDAVFSTLGQSFDNTLFPILTANFGNPLALDPLLDNDGKIVMVFTPLVRTFASGGIAGFVSPCDLFPRSTFSGSNLGEYAYMITPTTTMETNSQTGLPFWQLTVRGLIIHEVKHVTAAAERLSRALTTASLEESWLEELLARHAEELLARSYQGNAWKGNTSYAQSVFCDVRRTTPPAQCANWQYIMAGHWLALYNYYRSQQTLSLFGPATSGDFSFYNSGWFFMRWLVDNFATNESTFLQSLVQDATMRGVANVQARTGRTIQELIAKWSLAAFLDDVLDVRSNDQQLRIHSWNTAGIWAGLNTDFPSTRLPTPYAPSQATFGNFLVRAALNGGATMWVRISGTQSLPQLLSLSGQSGAALPSGIRMAIIRFK